jgi:hypothetical protein
MTKLREGALSGSPNMVEAPGIAHSCTKAGPRTLRSRDAGRSTGVAMTKLREGSPLGLPEHGGGAGN